MFKKIADRYFAWECHLRDSFGDDIETPKGRFWAYVHFHLMDHAFFSSVVDKYARNCARCVPIKSTLATQDSEVEGKGHPNGC